MAVYHNEDPEVHWMTSTAHIASIRQWPIRRSPPCAAQHTPSPPRRLPSSFPSTSSHPYVPLASLEPSSFPSTPSIPLLIRRVKRLRLMTFVSPFHSFDSLEATSVCSGTTQTLVMKLGNEGLVSTALLRDCHCQTDRQSNGGKDPVLVFDTVA